VQKFNTNLENSDEPEPLPQHHSPGFAEAMRQAEVFVALLWAAKQQHVVDPLAEAGLQLSHLW
jgi:hypothetical protein